MILYAMSYDIESGRDEDYETWARFAIRRTLAVPGVIELRGYRPIAGHSEIVITFEFENYDTWTTWFNHDDVQAVFEELFSIAVNVQRELWEPSPIIPEPIRP